MKRLIIILSLTVSTLSILLMAAPYFLRLTGLDKPLKRFVVSQIAAGSADSLDIETFNLSQNAIHFNNIIFKSENRQYELKIESIDVVFNFFKFLSSINKPLEAIQAIHIVKPKFVIYQSKMEKNDHTASSDSVQQAKIVSFIQDIKELPQIKYFTINEGEINYFVDDCLNGNRCL